MRALVSEDGAAYTRFLAVREEAPPDEGRVASGSSENNLLARSDEKLSPSSVAVSVGAVVALIEGEARSVPVFGKPPDGAEVKG